MPAPAEVTPARLSSAAMAPGVDPRLSPVAGLTPALAPVPIRTVVVKVASRCNLNCSYCYMYHKGDTSFLSQPKVMPQRIVRALAEKLRQHCNASGQDELEIIFHGGEPLLAGRAFFAKFISIMEDVLGPDIAVQYNMQTNATLLDEAWIAELSGLGIGIGVSLDGLEERHDAYRVDHRGRGSYQRVARAIGRLTEKPEWRAAFNGVLTVLDLETEPERLLEHYRSMGITTVDFLFPDGHHDALPHGFPADDRGAPYGEWLVRAFDAWFASGDTGFHVRLFESLIDLLLGNANSTDQIGGAHNALAVVETDGGIEPVDVLKICGEGFTKLGFNVLRDQFSAVQAHPLMAAYQAGQDALCDTCRRCPLISACGGGYMPHRFSKSQGFANPSIYCHDLTRLIRHIHARVLAALPTAITAEDRAVALA